ncbi:RNA polymerase sigma factor [Flagellimonas meridianipacifica]|uniref:RNA polymerase sigma-70 factor (ECF subfamily) n=1 Tax=Flagellimonas meridianipacifica TaxID=1080225 RepID=A0A2T0MHQ4_9FLAO|nr:sigma-70 family RNA polymerase sigma factor [Allomuricauda pacifica]PRX57092.1 RNA polymerase sigma-70 factor (ECF subfamily) [Allomuricauda pacifica]
MTNSNLNHTIDHLFRNEYGKLISLLTHKYGVSFLEQIEDAAQDTFLKAMQVWGYQSIPDNPTAWLFRVAQNRLIDVLRRDKKSDLMGDKPFPKEKTNKESKVILEDALEDSQLNMIFACCHPTLSQEYQIVLSLKLMGGFSNKELADALLKKEDAIAKSFTRAKKQFREKVQFLQIPVQMGLQSRLFQVLRVIYLLFSEGYAATTGAQLLKRDICYEALRLALLLRKNKYCFHPNLEALIALMCFHVSRFEARLDKEGNLVSLEHHDRSLYDQELIQIGIYHLQQAGTKDQTPSHYHLEAARSYYHCTALSFSETDWKNILYLYDVQLKQQYSPMVALNRIVPFGKVHGPKAALKELRLLEQQTDFSNSGLFYAIWAELLKEDNDVTFETFLKKAIALSENDLVKQHLMKKLR